MKQPVTTLITIAALALSALAAPFNETVQGDATATLERRKTPTLQPEGGLDIWQVCDTHRKTMVWGFGGIAKGLKLKVICCKHNHGHHHESCQQLNRTMGPTCEGRYDEGPFCCYKKVRYPTYDCPSKGDVYGTT